jgi:hypothetical protein
MKLPRHNMRRIFYPTKLSTEFMDQFCYENVLQEEIGGSRMRRYSIEEEKLHNSFADGDKTNQTLKGYNGA